LIVRVLVEPTLRPLDEALTQSTLGTGAKIGITRIGDPLSKPRMWDEKLFKTYNNFVMHK
jgi:hypothetical protein